MHVNVQPISPVPCQANLRHTSGSLHTARKAALIEGLTVNQLGVDKGVISQMVITVTHLELLQLVGIVHVVGQPHPHCAWLHSPPSHCLTCYWSVLPLWSDSCDGENSESARQSIRKSPSTTTLIWWPSKEGPPIFCVKQH